MSTLNNKSVKKTGPVNPALKVVKQKGRMPYVASEEMTIVTENTAYLSDNRIPGIIPGAAPRTNHVMNTGILAGVATRPESHMTAFEKMDIARNGISKRELENLKQIAALDYEELAQALSVTRATLINKKGDNKFNSSLSERILGLADIYSYGYSVFEDEDRFNKWMFRPNQALGGKQPYELVDNQFGREEVRNMIGRIEYGVYS